MNTAAMTLLILSTWISGRPDSQQVSVIPVATMAECEKLRLQAIAKMDIQGRYVDAICIGGDK